jgi:hypothetical protein
VWQQLNVLLLLLLLLLLFAACPGVVSVMWRFCYNQPAGIGFVRLLQPPFVQGFKHLCSAAAVASGNTWGGGRAWQRLTVGAFSHFPCSKVSHNMIVWVSGFMLRYFRSCRVRCGIPLGG